MRDAPFPQEVPDGRWVEGVLVDPQKGRDLLGRVVHEVLAHEVLGRLLEAVAVLAEDLKKMTDK